LGSYKKELATQVDADTFAELTKTQQQYAFHFNIETLEIKWQNIIPYQWKHVDTKFKLTSEVILNTIYKDLYKQVKAVAEEKAMKKLKKKLITEELQQANIYEIY